jgi:hypothetical protein
MKQLVLLIFVFIFITGCAKLSIVSVNKEAMSSISAESIIFVPRFEGNSDFAEESTDYFIAILESKVPNTIVHGSVLRTEQTDISSSGNIAPLKTALSTASDNGADILIMGKVTSHKTAEILKGFSIIRVYSVQTGERLANFPRPGGMLMGYSEHQAVMAAVKRTANDFADSIR